MAPGASVNGAELLGVEFGEAEAKGRAARRAPAAPGASPPPPKPRGAAAFPGGAGPALGRPQRRLRRNRRSWVSSAASGRREFWTCLLHSDEEILEGAFEQWELWLCHGSGRGGEAQPPLHQRAPAPPAADPPGARHRQQLRGAEGFLEALHPHRVPPGAPDLALLLLNALPATQRSHQRVDPPGGHADPAAALPAALSEGGFWAGPARPAAPHHHHGIHHLPDVQHARSPPAGQVRVLALQLLLHGLRGGGHLPVRQRAGALLLCHRAQLAREDPGLLHAHGRAAGLAVVCRLVLRQVPLPPVGVAAEPAVPGGALGPGLPAGHQPRCAPHLHRITCGARGPGPAVPQVPGAVLPHRCLFFLPSLPREVAPREMLFLRAEPPDLPRLPGALHAGADRGRGAGLRVQAAHLLLAAG